MVQYLGIGPGFEAVMVVTGLEGERSNWLWGHNRAPRRKGQKSAREIPARESFEAPLTNRLDASSRVCSVEKIGREKRTDSLFVKQRAAVLIQQTGSHHIKLLALCCPHSETGQIAVARHFLTKRQKRPLPLLQAVPWSGQARRNGAIKVAKLGHYY